ncbi:hypothetical protein HWV62_4033 [Athelia sp. TMB]|nr:hypothetical protein HWV62_4033 [Athelia sp. TMB]
MTKSVLRGRSARGLSLPSYILETLAYAITSTYSIRNGFPFSTYGESTFLAMQNVVITLLIIYYPSTSLRQDHSTTSRLTYVSLATIVWGIALFLLQNPLLAFLQLCTLPLSVLAKLPQIQQNARAQSTGQLSLFAVASQVVGCLARLFTTATEVRDAKLAAGFALALALNSIVAAQMWMYWGKDGRERGDTLLPLVKTRLGLVGSQDLGGRTQIVMRPHSPVMRSGWARKAE